VGPFSARKWVRFRRGLPIGRWDEARASLKQSVDILEALVVREPGNINREEDLGGTHLSLGVTLRGLGRKEEALAEWQRATDILARLVAREPAEAHVRSTLSRSAE
jgi:tetratricopeptide (TPR) repeat protein